MKTEMIISQYNGGLKYLEKNIDKKIIIFVIDDQQVYLELLAEKLSKHGNFSVMKFSTGEEALSYVGLKPDLIVVDYHLDGFIATAKNGSEIASLFKAELPNVEVVIISSDHKLSFLSALDQSDEKMMFKDGFVADRLSSKSEDVLAEKQRNQIVNKVILASVIALAAVFICSVFVFPNLG